MDSAIIYESEHYQQLFSRIEDQLLVRFNLQYPDKSYYTVDDNDREQAFAIIQGWVDFLIEERKVGKKNNIVIDMKNRVIDLRLALIVQKAYKLGFGKRLQFPEIILNEVIPKYFPEAKLSHSEQVQV